MVTAILSGADGHTLASGSWDETVRLWNAASGKERAVLRGHKGWVYAVALSGEACTLASGSGVSKGFRIR